MAIKIFTDSSCDLPKDYIEKNNIHVVPLHVTFEDGTYLDRVNLEVNDFYHKMKHQDELPKTAAPSPHDFIQLLENKMELEDEGIIISLSSALSSTYTSAKMAVEMFRENNLNTKIEAIDSKNASIGVGIVITHTIDMIKAGLSYQEIVTRVKEVVDNTQTLIFLDSLENIIKGGRLDKVKGKIATVLSIKLLMKKTHEGSLDVVEKVRGSKNAMYRLIELIGEYGGSLEGKIFGIAHSNCEEKAKEIKRMIEDKYKTSKVILTEIGPTIGTYAGEDGILISF